MKETQIKHVTRHPLLRRGLGRLFPILLWRGLGRLLLLLAITLPTSAQPNKSKIVVLSDPHVMAPQLLVSDGTAWQNFLNNSRKLEDYSRELFDELMTRIGDDIKPELLLITGDMAKDGERLSHEYVVAKLDELRAKGIQTLVIPGNHDRGANDNAVYYDGDNTTPAEVCTDQTFATLYAQYGYGDSSERDPLSLSYACEPIRGLVIIGIDSGTGGSVTAATLQWVCQQAAKAQADGKWVMAMMHHPLEPHFLEADKFINTVAVTDYENVRNQLADAGISILFTGHFHTSDILKDYNADITKEIYDISTGSLASFPCDYRILTLDWKNSQLDIETAHISELPGHDRSNLFACQSKSSNLFACQSKNFAAKAEQRLKASIKNAIASQGGAYSYVAEDAAKAYIEHAKGNEHESAEAQSILSTLLGYASLAKMLHLLDDAKIKQLENMAHSMLEDLSNYGDAERENRTNDLTLTISLPENKLVTAIATVKGATAPGDVNPRRYTLGGILLKNKPHTKGIIIIKI